jgi:hypothetical protein
MDRILSSSRLLTLTAGALVVAFAAVAIAAAALGAPAAPADPSPTTPIGGVPTPPPSDGPSLPPTPSPTPVEHPPIAGDVTIDLFTATGHDVEAMVRDTTRTITRVDTGRAGAGMSVRWHDILVRQVDARTVSVTWIGLAIDDEVHVDVAFENSVYLIEIVQTGPEPGTDATGYDRELILTFEQPVVAADVLGGVADRS